MNMFLSVSVSVLSARLLIVLPPLGCHVVKRFIVLTEVVLNVCTTVC